MTSQIVIYCKRMKKLFVSGSNGHGIALISWQPDGRHVACTRKHGFVEILDACGSNVDTIKLPKSPITSLEWDSLGVTIAILQTGASIVHLYNFASSDLYPLNSGGIKPSWFSWSKKSSFLAIGSSKGKLLIHNVSTRTNEMIAVKHSDAIVCGSWSYSGHFLAVGSKDKIISLSSCDGKIVSFSCFLVCV